MPIGGGEIAIGESIIVSDDPLILKAVHHLERVSLLTL
jgi:hypothetical protein